MGALARVSFKESKTFQTISLSCHCSLFSLFQLVVAENGLGVTSVSTVEEKRWLTEGSCGDTEAIDAPTTVV